MDPVFEIKNKFDDFETEFALIPSINQASLSELEKQNIEKEIEAIDIYNQNTNLTLEKLNSEIENLTNTADGIDYAMSVICGLITGIIDSVFVGEWDFKQAKAKANKDINTQVIEFAKKQPGYKDYIDNKRTSNSQLENAIRFLEEKFKLPGDGAYINYENFGITHKTHHLDDFSHHPTLVGMVCSILVQFSGNAKYHCASGISLPSIPISVNDYGNVVSNDRWGKVFAGIINWFISASKSIANQKGHIMSDVSGSSSSAKKRHTGAGVPGGFMSTLKELSTLPCIKDTNFGENLRKAYQNGIGNGKKQVDLGSFNVLFEGADSKVDLRTEKAVTAELKRQAFPVILNEVLVRSCYFIRRFIWQMKEKRSLSEFSFSKALPFGNRTISRMITIASGTFTAVDLADAGIRSAIKSGGITGPEFIPNMILRINFVGVGRFAIAVGTDTIMGVSRKHKRDNRIALLNTQLQLTGAKVYYKEAEVWIAAEKTDKKIEIMYKTAETSVKYYCESVKEITNNIDIIKKEITSAQISSEAKEKYLRMLRR